MQNNKPHRLDEIFEKNSKAYNLCDASGSKEACHQGGKPKFDFWKPHTARVELRQGLSLTSTCIIEHVCAHMDKHTHVSKLKCLKIIKCISSGIIRFHQWFP